MSRRARTWRTIVWPFAGLSAVAHVAIVVLVLVLGRTSCDVMPDPNALVEAPIDPNAQPMEVTMIEPAVLDPFAAPQVEKTAAEAEQQKKVEEAKKPEDDRNAQGQVVEVAKPAVEERPDKSDFLSNYDTKVQHQTRAKGDHPGLKQPAIEAPPTPPTPPGGKPQDAQEAKPETKAGPQGKGVLAMRETQAPRAATPAGQPGLRGPEDGLQQTAPDGTAPAKGDNGSGAEQAPTPGADGQQAAQPQQEPGGDGGPGSKALPKLDALRPSEAQLARVIGAGSSDYLKDIDDGAETLLSSKRWKFADFFNRMKESVRDNWHPDEKYAMRDPYGQIYGLKNRFTVLKVSLHPDGTVRDILIERPSGVDFLDEEAVNAFKTAQPFANPPEGLVDPSSHLITFRFGFFFEISGSPTFKIFRAN